MPAAVNVASFFALVLLFGVPLRSVVWSAEPVEEEIVMQHRPNVGPDVMNAMDVLQGHFGITISSSALRDVLIDSRRGLRMFARSMPADPEPSLAPALAYLWGNLELFGVKRSDLQTRPAQVAALLRPWCALSTPAKRRKAQSALGWRTSRGVPPG